MNDLVKLGLIGLGAYLLLNKPTAAPASHGVMPIVPQPFVNPVTAQESAGQLPDYIPVIPDIAYNIGENLSNIITVGEGLVSVGPVADTPQQMLAQLQVQQGEINSGSILVSGQNPTATTIESIPVSNVPIEPVVIGKGFWMDPRTVEAQAVRAVNVYGAPYTGMEPPFYYAFFQMPNGAWIQSDLYGTSSPIQAPVI